MRPSPILPFSHSPFPHFSLPPGGRTPGFHFVPSGLHCIGLCSTAKNETRILLRVKDNDVSLSDRLQALALTSVTITAAIDASGHLSPVGGLWPKLLAAAKEAATVGLLRTIVVASEQADIPSELEQETAAPLRVLRAATLHDAINRLYEEHGPRHAVRQYEREHCAALPLLGRAVSLTAHYQALPLLREVKRDRLLRTGRKRGQEEDAQTLRSTDILRWEEEVSGEHVTYEKIELDQLFTRFQAVTENAQQTTPRFVVLGPPGSGKTTLLQYLSGQAATDRLPTTGRKLLPVRVSLREWETFTAATVGVAQQLSVYLAQQYGLLSPAPTAQQWRQWLSNGDVLLLLDGLDEIQGDPTFLTLLTTTVATFTACPTVLTCRTVSFERHRLICPDFPLFTLTGLDQVHRDAYIRAFPAVHATVYQPEVLSGHLQRSPQLRSLAANPLLLSILCYVADSAPAAPFPATRGQLYANAIERLLTFRAQRLSTIYPGTAPAPHEKLALIQHAALQLFAHGERQLTFSGQQLTQALKDALTEEGYGSVSGPWANALREDLLHNSGLLRGDGERGFFFFHLTIQEFLTAGALATHINTNGWTAPLRIAGKSVRVSQLIDKKSWDPRWHEVIVLLTGQLADPLPLLTLLTDNKKDDIFFHRLALAAQSLAEVRAEVCPSLSHLVDRVTEHVFSTWLSRETCSTGAVVSHFTDAFAALAQVNGCIKQLPLLRWLQLQLHDTNPDVRAGIIEAFANMGESLASDMDILEALLCSLGDPDVFVRVRTTEALRRIGAATLSLPSMLTALIQAGEHDPDGFVRTSAKRTLAQFAASVPHVPNVLSVFLARYPQRFEVEPGGHERSQPLAPLSSPLESDTHLVSTLYDPDPANRARALIQLKQLRPTGTLRLKILPALVEILLHDTDGGIRARAADALGHIGEALRQYPNMPSILMAALRDRDPGVRARTAEVCGQLDLPTVHSQEVLVALYEAVGDTDSEVRFAAAEALDRQMIRGVRLFKRWWGKRAVRTVEELARV